MRKFRFENLNPDLELANLGKSLRDIYPERLGYVNPRDFGAIGDGVNDDTKAVNDAIIFADAIGGATVFFESGTYKGNFIVDGYKVDLMGVGQDSVLTPYNDELPIVRIRALPGGERLRRCISKLCFIGPDNYAANEKAVCIYMNGWAGGPVSYCTFKNFHTAIYSNCQEWHQIDHCMFRPGVCALAFLSKSAENDVYGFAPLFAQHPTAGTVSYCSFNCGISMFIDNDYWANVIGGTDCGCQVHFLKNDNTGSVIGIISRNGKANPTQPLVFDTCWTENVGVGLVNWMGDNYNGAVLDIEGGRVDIRSSWLYGKYRFTAGCVVNYYTCQVVGPIDIECDIPGSYYGLDSDSLNTGQAVWFAKCNDVYDYKMAAIPAPANPNSTLCLVNRAKPSAASNGLTNLSTIANFGSGVWDADNGQTVTVPAIAGFDKVYQLNYPSALQSQLFLILPNTTDKFVVVSFLGRRISGNENNALSLFGCGFSGCTLKLKNSWQQFSFTCKYPGGGDYFRLQSTAIQNLQLANFSITPFDTYETAREYQTAPAYLPPV